MSRITGGPEALAQDDLAVVGVKIRERAAELVEQGWCQGAAAETVEGWGCTPSDPAAVRWCFIGAIAEAVRQLYGEDYTYRVFPFAWVMVGLGLNDTLATTADEVAAYLRRGPALAGRA